MQYWRTADPVVRRALTQHGPVRITVDTGSSVAELSTALAVAVSDQLLDTLSGLLGEGSVRLAEANGSSRTARAANGGRRR